MSGLYFSPELRRGEKSLDATQTSNRFRNKAIEVSADGPERAEEGGRITPEGSEEAQIKRLTNEI